MKDPFVEPNSQTSADAFARIVREYQRAVFAAAYAKTGNVHDAEDIKQEVFVDAWRNMHKFRNPKKIPAWLFKATVNKCKDHFRKSSRREKREREFAQAAPVAITGDMLDDAHIHDLVFQTVSTLPEEIRTVFFLKYFARLSYAEISQMTGLSKTTIDGRLRTGKKKLKQALIAFNKGDCPVIDDLM